ncbi:protein kinase domain-containing protein [Streptomyces sp. NBC_00272]|uniref:protein kinase domain-containing protein n=2 Tax=unclassified Streptomyces TaxID=2593676 RepID=UPI002E2E0345|nr:protein kinase [Streptomyces sp. NBC_00272]
MQPLREQDPERVADYRLLGRLGEGGMGLVYLARSPRGRMVAVKTIRAELAAAPDFRRRFAKETAVARQVGGEWTAAVLAADPDAVLPWVATAYVAGPTLQQVVTEQHGPLPEHSVRGLASGLCRALSDIHAAGLVHRDLKPSNIMVTIEGPKVIDFGIARALDSATGGLTSTGVVVGSPGFMSPEQIRGESLTEASDIFSLGSVLAFAASGRLPFEVAGGQAHALMYKVVHEAPDLTGVPEPLRELIETCLAKDPADRPTVADLQERQDTQYRSLGPWLPLEVLTRLGQEAVQLLDQEDPHTRMTPVDADPADEAMAAGPAKPLDSPTAVDQAPQRDQAGRAQEPSSRLVDERRRARGQTGPADGYRAAVYWFLALSALVSALTAIHQIIAATDQGHVYDHGFNPTWGDAWKYIADPWAWGSPVGILWTAQVLFGVGLVVSWLIWFARVRSVAEQFAAGRLRYRPSMAVVGWLIPVGNLFLPKQIANDVWHASSPPGQGDGTDPVRLLHTWWAACLVTLMTWPLFLTPWTTFRKEVIIEKKFAIAGQSEMICCEWDYRYEFQPETWFTLALHLLVVPAAIVTARYVHRVTAMQAAKVQG